MAFGEMDSEKSGHLFCHVMDIHDQHGYAWIWSFYEQDTKFVFIFMFI